MCVWLTEVRVWWTVRCVCVCDVCGVCVCVVD